ncbi:MAG: helix-turn-helix transcriptional regulator [Halanaerobiales bacterium]
MLEKIIQQQPWYKKIEILRVIKDYKQKELAEKVGVDRRVYWNWENGASIPVKRNKKKLASILGVEEAEIFGDLYNQEKLN